MVSFSSLFSTFNHQSYIITAANSYDSVHNTSYIIELNNVLRKITEPVHSIFHKSACGSSEDSDQPAHSRSLIRVFAGYANDPKRFHLDSENSDKTAYPRYPRWAHM